MDHLWLYFLYFVLLLITLLFTIILLLEIVRILCKITGLAFVNKYQYLKLSPERYLNVETAFMILFFSVLQLMISLILISFYCMIEAINLFYLICELIFLISLQIRFAISRSWLPRRSCAKFVPNMSPLCFFCSMLWTRLADDASGQIDEWTNKETDEVNDACNIIYCTQ